MPGRRAGPGVILRMALTCILMALPGPGPGATAANAPVAALAPPVPGSTARAGQAELSADASHARFVLPLDRQVEIAAFTLADPYRVIIDLPEITFAGGLGSREARDFVQSWRGGLFMAGRSRLVFDLAGPVRVSRAEIQPVEGGAFRLVVEMDRVEKARFVAVTARPHAEPPPREGAAPLAKGDREPVRADTGRSRRTVVLDPGHGGLDVGTRSPATGTVEKGIVLEVAQLLKQKLEKTGRYRVEMTRTSDIFVPLADRVKFARQQHADIFVSIHADAELDHSVRGATVYTVADKGSDDASEALALKENASDSLAGVVPEDSADDVAGILADLTRRETYLLNHSLAGVLVNGMSQSMRLTKGSGHRSAGFRVLKAYDVPSALVEIGFLSNKEDEALLMSAQWRDKMTAALVTSIDQFFAARGQGSGQ